MSRATRLLVSALCFAGSLLAPTRAQAGGVDAIDGAGLIDYGRKPNFKVGSWVKYHVTGSSEAGGSDDYNVTVLIAGEETFWGDAGFWVETWYEPKDGIVRAAASLVSYSIFDDPEAIPNLQFYLRKFSEGFDAAGNPIESVPKPASSLARNRTAPETRTWHVDTLGSQEVTVSRGTFLCRKVSLSDGVAGTNDQADSTIRREVTETRILHLSDKIPVTKLVRQDIEILAVRTAWKLGHSKEAQSRVEDRATGTATLVDFGEGLTPQLVPESVRKIARKPAAGGGPTPGTGRSGSGKRRGG